MALTPVVLETVPSELADEQIVNAINLLVQAVGVLQTAVVALQTA